MEVNWNLLTGNSDPLNEYGEGMLEDEDDESVISEEYADLMSIEYHQDIPTTRLSFFDPDKAIKMNLDHMHDWSCRPFDEIEP